MQIHASCAALDGAGVLLVGPPGSGKSDMTMRLLDLGFDLVADDRVEIEGDWARAPRELYGLLEVRGIGIVRLPALPRARLALAVELGADPARLPTPRRYDAVDLPVVAIDSGAASAAQRVAVALACALGRITQVAGAFA